ncbi:MAG: hypothetical protein ACOYB2_02975 [Limnohabitans sp.]
MSISRRELYAHGEPFGDGATQRRIDGKGYMCGFGGDSSSSSSNTTNNYDKRVVTNDGFGLSGDNNTVTMTTLDGGAIQKAFDFASANNAVLGGGYDALINAGQNLIGQTQKAVADAYGQAQADKNGTIDNRTIIVLAAVGAAAVFALRKK